MRLLVMSCLVYYRKERYHERTSWVGLSGGWTGGIAFKVDDECLNDVWGERCRVLLLNSSR